MNINTISMLVYSDVSFVPPFTTTFYILSHPLLQPPHLQPSPKLCFPGNIALVHYKQGNYPQALNMYTERLASIWQFYGNVHPSIADTLNNIAAVHDKQGNYVEAILGEYKRRGFVLICTIIEGSE